MTVAVAAWTNLSAMGALDYEHRIQTIVSGSTYLSEEDSSFILHAIRHTSYTRFFAKYAERIEWLLWAEANNLLKALFQPDSLDGDLFEVLAGWIAEKYLVSETDAVLALIQRQGQQLNPVLWNLIARRLNADTPRMDPSKLAMVIPILLKSAHPRNHIDFLSYLLVACKVPENVTTALLLFEFLSKPKLNLQRSFPMEGDERVVAPGIEIDLSGEDHWLQDAWKNLFSPNISCFARELEIISAGHLLHADSLQKRARQQNL